MGAITSDAAQGLCNLLYARAFCPCRTMRVTRRFACSPLVLPPTNGFWFLFCLPHIFIVIFLAQAALLPIALSTPCSLPARLRLFYLAITLLGVRVLAPKPAN
jgi:hypothetical protein